MAVNKVIKSDGTTLIDITGTTATASDVASGKYFFLSSGEKVEGTASATQHIILFEFTDETTQSITGYWDSSFISDAITATEPTTIGQKTVDSASIDGVAWYTRPTAQWETLYEGSARIVSSSPNYIAINSFSEAIGEGETWRITWDGTLYTCTAVYSSQISGWYIGNARIVVSGSTDTGEPFWAYKRTSSQLAFSTNQSAGNISLKIEKNVS